jgi:hypothetical protein
VLQLQGPNGEMAAVYCKNTQNTKTACGQQNTDCMVLNLAVVTVYEATIIRKGSAVEKF